MGMQGWGGGGACREITAHKQGEGLKTTAAKAATHWNAIIAAEQCLHGAASTSLNAHGG